MGHPCLSCGACCAHFRVAFHWLESAGAGPDRVPVELTVKLDPHRLAMRGTEGGAHPRCVALAGAVGQDAHCGIYARRPSPCRDLEPSWEHGRNSPQCDRARIAHGLSPLTPADWVDGAAA